jgi:ankyrin repeat protein
MTRDCKGKTPLHTACQTGASDCVPLLLDAGADINAVTSTGSTPIHSCFYFGNIGPFEAIVEYLKTSDIKPDGKIKQKDGYTPLMSTICHNEPKFLQYLIDNRERLAKLGLEDFIPGQENVQKLFEITLSH